MTINSLAAPMISFRMCRKAVKNAPSLQTNIIYFAGREGVNKSQNPVDVIQTGYIGCNTGNGEKLSNSQACCLA